MPEKSLNHGIYEYLCVDNFLSGFLDVQSLKAAFELGLIDQLTRKPEIQTEELAGLLGSDPGGLAMLLELLKLNNVIQEDDEFVKFSASFRKALEYRDLLTVKIEFSDFITTDISEKFGIYIRNPVEFMGASRLFDLFSYHRCYQVTEENLAATGKWVRYTTTFTRYEARVCLHHHDFGSYISMLDIGGNSGEFALQACRSNSEIEAIVVDLPVVCEIGRSYLKDMNGADRIHFLEADALIDDLPGNFDIVTFKSVLHDWPDDAAGILLSRAGTCLSTKGTILIFERIKIDKLKSMPAYGNLPVFLFNRHYRKPEYYRTLLEKSGFEDIEVKIIQLEIPFMLISATKR